MNNYEKSTQLFRQAHDHLSAGEYATAIALFNASLDVEPNAQAFRGLGECHSALGQDREAILYFSASAGLRPMPKVSFQLAQTLFRSGYLDEAKRAAERAISAMPHFKAAHSILGEINDCIAKERPPIADDSATH
jgi:tetratricopeptide (TPR) repeat protein